MQNLAQIILLGLGILLIYFSAHEEEDLMRVLLLRLIGFSLIGLATLGIFRNFMR